MSDYIDCPDGGQMRPPQTSDWVVWIQAMHAQEEWKYYQFPFNHADVAGIPVSDMGFIDRSRTTSMTRAFRKSGTSYLQADSPIFSEMSLDDSQIQQYIENPWSVSFTEDQESSIRDGICKHIEDIADDVDVNVDELSPEEIDMACQAAYNSIRKVDVMRGMAKRMAPRTFTHNCVDTEQPNSASSQKTRDAFKKAMDNYDVGSDEWYDTIADGYLGDMRKSKKLIHGRGGSESEELIAADRKAISSALKDAIGEVIEDVDSDYELPSIDVVWTGPLSDTSSDARYDEILQIERPHIVFTDPYAGAISDPVRLGGIYSIKISGSESAKDGPTSNIRDDMTMKQRQVLYYPDNSGLSQLSSKTVKY